MKIVIPGGSGHVGTLLARHFHRTGDEVVVLSRRAGARPWRTVRWDGVTLGAWQREVDGCDVVINLAGRSVDCRYTRRHQREILESRVFSTRVVGQAIAAAPRPPKVWLQASTATIYAHRYEAANDEDTEIVGGEEPEASPQWRFSVDVALAWERAFDDARCEHTRKVAMRSALTLSPDHGSVFHKLLTLTKWGLGGAAGDGRQFVSWIHGHDFVAAVRWLMEHEDVDGVVNIASPQPVPNREFMSELRHASGVRFGLPATEWMLSIGAIVLRTETELLLKSRRVVPARLLRQGFAFRFPDWRAAARDLCRPDGEGEGGGSP